METTAAAAQPKNQPKKKTQVCFINQNKNSKIVY